MFRRRRPTRHGQNSISLTGFDVNLSLQIGTLDASIGRIPAVPCSLTARQVGVPKRTSHRINSEQTSRRR